MPAKGQPLPIKCVLLGDSGCGKTSLTLAYSGQSLPEVYASDAAPFNVVAKAAGVQVRRVVHLGSPWNLRSLALGQSVGSVLKGM